MRLDVQKLCIGQLNPLKDGQDVLSGIDKRLINRSIRLTKLGFEGDMQGDVKHHGGADKAVHHYSADHYQSWLEELPVTSDVIQNFDAPFGENISTQNASEKDICLGDVFKYNNAILEVSQGRQPCWRLNCRFGVHDMSKRVQETGRTGWYYRVLEEGTVEPFSPLELLERPYPRWTLSYVLELLYKNPKSFSELEDLVKVKTLPGGWKKLIQNRIDQRSVEDWSLRLSGKA